MEQARRAHSQRVHGPARLRRRPMFAGALRAAGAAARATDEENSALPQHYMGRGRRSTQQQVSGIHQDYHSVIQLS